MTTLKTCRLAGGVVLGAIAMTAATAGAAIWRIPGNGTEIPVVIDLLAAPGDTVQVMGNGGATFFTRFAVSKDLTIQGGWRADFQVRDPSIYVTVIQDIPDAFANERSIVRVNGSPRVEFDGITFVGGRFGVRADEGATLIVRDCVFRNQRNETVPAEGFRLAGGGMRVVGGTVLVERTTILNSFAIMNGAGMAILGASSAILRDCTIRNCLSRFLPGDAFDTDGAGIYAVGVADLEISGTVLENNNSLNRGGHLYARDTNVTIAGSRFVRGAGSLEGGGIYATGGTISVSGSTFESCVSGSGAGIQVESAQGLELVDVELRRNLGSSEGSAVRVSNTPFSIRECLFEHNHQEPPATIRVQRGGGVRAVASPGTVEDTIFRDEAATSRGGAWAQVGGDVVFRRCRFEGNRCILNGGSIDLELSGTVRAEQCLFVDGTAKFGAGIAGSFGANFEIDHCTFSRGTATSNGGAVYLETASFATITNSILCCATQSELVACPAASFSLANCDIWNDDSVNPRDEFLGSCVNPIGSNGNFSANPAFCDPNAVDLRLAPGSPCVGAGSDGSDLGWMPAGCPGGTPLHVTPDTWSRIKARYLPPQEGSRGLD